MGLLDLFRRKPATFTDTLNRAASTKSTELDAYLLNGVLKKDGTPRFPVEVKGESQYQAALHRVAGRPSDYVQVQKLAALVPEPNNPHDENAVRVVIEGHLVGYLAAEDAEDYEEVLQTLAGRRQVGACQAMIYGGGEKSFGVWLSLAAPEKTLSES